MSDALRNLVELLDLEPIEVNIFRGVQPDEDRQRVFGGQVAGQALVAAARTVDEPDRHVHSLHAYFLRPGDPSVPILYDVDRLRDGRSFTTRRVVAIQHGRPIFNLQASFHDVEPGLDYHLEAPTDVPAPESLPTFQERMEPHRARVGDWFDRPRPIDTRYVPPDPALEPGVKADGQTGLDARRRPTPRRPGASRLHRHVRERHDAARHDAAAVRHVVAHRRPDDGQPRSCDVVPSAVPSRRMAALPPATRSPARPRGASRADRSSRPTGKLVVNVVQEGLIRVLT